MNLSVLSQRCLAVLALGLLLFTATATAQKPGVATAQDLVRLADGFFTGDLLEAETRADFSAPIRLNDGETVSWGLGWDMELDDNGEVLWYGHGGATNGAHASLRYYPASRTAIAGIITYNYWLTDRRPGFFEFVESDLAELFLNQQP